MAWMYIGLIVTVVLVAAEVVRTGASLGLGRGRGGRRRRHGRLHPDADHRAAAGARRRRQLEGPLGMASLFAEGLSILLAGSVVTARARVEGGLRRVLVPTT